MKNINFKNRDECIKFILECDRAEAHGTDSRNWFIYYKGVRSCLLALGYDKEVINEYFYDITWDVYHEIFDDK